MAGELEAVVRTMFSRFDAKDYAAALQTVSQEVQAVDEISRHWMRGHDDLRQYMAQLEQAVTDVRSEIGDVHETVLGDIGLVTCWLEQDYTLEGERTHVSAPTSVVLRREDGAWRITLFHSVPLAAEA